MEPDLIKEKEKLLETLGIWSKAAKPSCKRCYGKGFVIVIRGKDRTAQQCTCTAINLRTGKA